MEHRICSTELPGSPQRPVSVHESLAAAGMERVDNTRLTPFVGGKVLRAVIEKARMWQPGRTLRIAFMDGDANVQMRVMRVAAGWLPHINLNFELVPPGSMSDIRISFTEKGYSWSYVGTDALVIPQDQPTMMYGWLEPWTDEEEYQRVVLHEFGHAMGLHHEHQNPTARIPWDVERVYAYYAQQGWTKDDVDQNLFAHLAEDLTNFSQYDPQSIMHYAIPESLTIGTYSVGWNTILSETDKLFMSKQYPRSAEIVELNARNDAVSSSLDAGGEVDTFTFEVTDPAQTYIITTTGNTDTILTVHGPEDPQAVLVWDDDRGKLTNARIVKRLYKGRYWLTVRHKRLDATGTYTVSIKQRAQSNRVKAV